MPLQNEERFEALGNFGLKTRSGNLITVLPVSRFAILPPHARCLRKYARREMGWELRPPDVRAVFPVATRKPLFVAHTSLRMRLLPYLMVENVSLSFTSFIRREIGHQDSGPYRVCFVYSPVTAKLCVRPSPFPVWTLHSMRGFLSLGWLWLTRRRDRRKMI